MQSRGCPGLQATEGSAGAEGPFPKMVCSHGCWQKASAPHHRGLPRGQTAWESSQHGSWFSPGSGDQKKEKGKSQTGFYDQVSQITHCHFCIFLFISWKLRRPGYTQGERNYVPVLKGRGNKEFLYYKPRWLLVVGSSLLIKIPKTIFIIPHDTASLSRGELCVPMGTQTLRRFSISETLQFHKIPTE